MLIGSGLDAASADRYAARAARAGAMTGPLNWYRALPLEVAEPVPPITVPTLYVWGDRDRFITRAAAELCGRYVTGAYRYEVLRGATHWMPQTAPGAVAGLLIEHFTTSTAPSALGTNPWHSTAAPAGSATRARCGRFGPAPGSKVPGSGEARHQHRDPVVP
jgi:hypothetical protein